MTSTSACAKSTQSHMHVACRRAEDLIRRLGIPWDAADARTPVLAIGSNAGPEQLLRKYPPDLFPAGVAIPCVRCMLPGFDVAFAPLLSSYGSCTGHTSTLLAVVACAWPTPTCRTCSGMLRRQGLICTMRVPITRNIALQ